MNFQLDMVSIGGKIFSGEVKEVILPGIDGEVSILARHMPIVIPLDIGEVTVKTPDKILTFSIGKGLFTYNMGVGKLLMEDVSSSDEISEMHVLEAKRKAEELLASGIKGEEKREVMYLLRKSLVDLKIVRRKKKIIV